MHPRPLGAHAGRALHALTLPSLTAWPPALLTPATPFTLLLACDARSEPDAAVDEAARRALAAGLVYTVAWGPGCERVHDRFDRVIEEQGRDEVLTTWHDDEPLEEALWFFVHAAAPPTPCRTGLVAVVGACAEAERVARALAPWHDDRATSTLGP
ncbi:MAG: hypothetical protein KF878_19865 [Planctomycetes bacterium]|nr:hypothetical protein [Planctomycetota bacterium]